MEFSFLFRISRIILLLNLCVDIYEGATDRFEPFLDDFWAVKVVFFPGSFFGCNTHHSSPVLSPFLTNFRRFSTVFNLILTSKNQFNSFYTNHITFRSSSGTYQHTWTAKTIINSCSLSDKPRQLKQHITHFQLIFQAIFLVTYLVKLHLYCSTFVSDNLVKISSSLDSIDKPTQPTDQLSTLELIPATDCCFSISEIK